MLKNDALAKGRFKRSPTRWQTKFGRWVAEFTVPAIVENLAHDPDLRITNQAVYEWLQGHAPQPARAIALVKMSRGRLTLEDIYHHPKQIRQLKEPGGQR